MLFLFLLAADSPPAYLAKFPPVYDVSLLAAYPDWALKAKKSASATMRVTLDAKGKMAGCEVVNFVGDPKLAKEFCDIAARKKLEPIRLADGTKVAGTFQTSFKMLVPDSPQGGAVQRARYTQVPDVSAAIPALSPTLAGAIRTATVVFASAGAAPACRLSGDRKEPAIEPDLCRQAIPAAAALRTKAGRTGEPFAAAVTARLEPAAK